MPREHDIACQPAQFVALAPRVVVEQQPAHDATPENADDRTATRSSVNGETSTRSEEVAEA